MKPPHTRTPHDVPVDVPHRVGVLTFISHGSCLDSPVKRLAPTGERDASRMVVLWDDV